MLRVLTDRRSIAGAARVLRRAILKGRRFQRVLGAQGESAEHAIHWHPAVGAWAVQVLAHNRYWQAFGVDNPTDADRLSIAAEINPPLAGINRRVGGVFLTDGDFVFLGHRGSPINQVPKVAFRRHFDAGQAGRWVRVEDGDRRTEVILLGPVGDPAIMRAVARFTREVLRVKRLVRGMK